MLLDVNHSGGGHDGPSCLACKQPILEAQRAVDIAFQSDPHGFKGLSGRYHLACGRPFASLARIIDMVPPGFR